MYIWVDSWRDVCFPGAGNLHDNELIDSVVLIGEEPQKGIKPSFAGNA